MSPDARACGYRIDGRPVTREDFYAIACDPQRSVVVEACAGAGKTWMLVSRILRALLEGAKPHEILAITFTRKAAGEMRERLNEWLAEPSATALEPTTSASRALVELRDASRRRAGRRRSPPAARRTGLHGRVLARPARSVEIRTFHAWFSQLLRRPPRSRCSTELGLQRRSMPTLIEDLDEHQPSRAPRFPRARCWRDDALHGRPRGARLRAARPRRSCAVKWLDAAWDRRGRVRAGRRGQACSTTSVEPAARTLWPG